jgi:hypothetical protein
MKIILIIITTFLLIESASSKTKEINLSKARIAINYDIDNYVDFVQIGMTVFGDNQFRSEFDSFSIKNIFIEKFNFALQSISGESVSVFESVKLLNENDVKDLNRRERKKAIKEQRKITLNEFKEKNFTHLLIVKEYLNRYSPQTRKFYNATDSIGFIKTGAIICSNLSFVVEVIELKQFNSQTLRVTYKDLSHSDDELLCESGKHFEKKNFPWVKNFGELTNKEIKILDQLLKDLVNPSIVTSLVNSKSIRNDLDANQLLLDLSLDEFLIIEKTNHDEFVILKESYSSEELKNEIVQLASKNKKTKVLVGYETKGKFVYGDITNMILPGLKDTNIKTYRFGKKKDLILVK